MEEVSRSDRPLPVKVIARRCRLHVSTAYHLVRTLCYEGYLVRLPSGDYVAGSGLAERFHDLMNSLGRPPQARAVLRQLAETTGHSAYLACISGQRLVVVDLEEGDRSPWLEDLQPGLDAAAHATAVGKALLSTLPRRDRRTLLAEQGMRPFTSNTVTERPRSRPNWPNWSPAHRSLSSASSATTCVAPALRSLATNQASGGRWAPPPAAWTCPLGCSANCSARLTTSPQAGITSLDAADERGPLTRPEGQLRPLRVLGIRRPPVPPEPPPRR